MTNKGKHSSQTPGTFYRDLAIMIMGIIVVGAAVFFILYFLADKPATGPTTTTTTLAKTSTTNSSVTSTTSITSTSSSGTSTTVAVRPPSEVTIVVLNSMGLDGAAGRLTDEMAEAGYQSLPAANYEPEQSPSRIWYREGFAPEAAALLEFLPGAIVESLPDETLNEGADVVLVLGTGYTE